MNPVGRAPLPAIETMERMAACPHWIDAVTGYVVKIPTVLATFAPHFSVRFS
jgi:hypothetical protein